MAVNRGKQFESKVKEDWERSLPESVLLRLPDQMSGYAGYSSNICDYIGFAGRCLWLVECKSIHGNTLPFTNLRQYDKLLAYKDKPYTHPGVILWWVDLDKVAFIPIQSIEKMKADNKKSINIKMLNSDEYFLLEIPSKKKRVFMDSDYSILLSLED